MSLVRKPIRPWTLSLLLGVTALASLAIAQTPDDEAIATTRDGIRWTEARIDSVLQTYPEYVRRAYRKEGLIWQGHDRTISFEELAAAAGPILWLSPDEPLLDDRSGEDIRIPTAMGFQDVPDRPVVYYRVRTILEDTDADAAGPILSAVDPERRTTLIDLDQTSGIDLDFFFYYPSEEGLNAHVHDVESVELKLVVVKTPRYPELGKWIVIQKAIAKAHGILWYDNTLEFDRAVRLPLHIMVEEGKHASCTDKNGDGFYSPGYDVNTRVNDAWGVRDIMASGGLYTGSFQSWMAKPRRPEHRVFPPLPEDSPLRERYTEDGVYAPDNAIYELRPFPRPEAAEAYDAHLAHHFIADKGDPDWPHVESFAGLNKFSRWVESEPFVKSLSISYRYDGKNGFSFVFPLFIVKNFEDPLAGGWLLNRIYLRDKHLRDFSWNVLYTTSASRWLDSYFTFGWEWDDDGTRTETNVMTEVGIKLRFSVGRTPLEFLSAVTDYWGLRVGVKNLGLWEWKEIGYAVEFGAGSF